MYIYMNIHIYIYIYMYIRIHIYIRTCNPISISIILHKTTFEINSTLEKRGIKRGEKGGERTILLTVENPYNSQLQIGWHRISRVFLKKIQPTRILPMGFTISTTQ